MYYVTLLIEMSVVASQLRAKAITCKALDLLCLHLSSYPPLAYFVTWSCYYYTGFPATLQTYRAQYPCTPLQVLFSLPGTFFPMTFTWSTPKPLGNHCGNVTISVRNSQIILFKIATLSATQHLLSLPCFISLYSPQHYPTSCTFYLFTVCFHHQVVRSNR